MYVVSGLSKAAVKVIILPATVAQCWVLPQGNCRYLFGMVSYYICMGEDVCCNHAATFLRDGEVFPCF